jgi:hypothetical protein
MTRRLILLAACLLAACDTGLEVKGALSRVVGETVTLALQGDPTFNGELSLRAADGKTLDAAALQLGKKDPRTLEFVIPAGIAPGPATAIAGRTGGGTFEVPLEVSRLALTLDGSGNLETWPLSPTSLKHSSLATGAAAAALMSLSPGGGELALAANDQVRLLALGPELKDLGAGVMQAGVIGVAAAPGGRVLCATADSLILFHFARGQQTTQEAIAFKDVRKVVASATGDLGIVLYACGNAGCLVEVSLTPTFAELPTTRVTLPGAPTAVIGATRNGKGVVVADGAAIYGTSFETTPPRQSKVEWGLSTVALPVGLVRAPAIVSDQPVDLFALAEQTTKRIDLLAFNAASGFDLQQVDRLTLDDAPSGVSYGRGAQLYVTTDKKLITLDASAGTPLKAPVPEVAPANPITSFAVQP